jgi:predicted AlkP superfamily phosphohydrolase/phosphomutase
VANLAARDRLASTAEPSSLLGWAQANQGRAKKVLVIGLDSAPPELLLDRFAPELPQIGRLRAESVWGPLESVVPAITIPAWACAMTGCDPGQLGIYGFRHHVCSSYAPSRFVDSTDLRADAVWDTLARQGRPVIVMGVPPGYPPRRVHGSFISCFLTPDGRRPATHPRDLADTIARVADRYAVDVEDHRLQDRDRLLREVREMTEQRFRLLRHLLRTQAWDFAMMVEIGLDRIHHAFLGACDPGHREYLAGGPFEHAVLDYYRLLDQEIGATLQEIDAGTAVLVLSDHGVKRLQGGIAINEWLVKEKLLALRTTPEGRVALQPEMVDWSRTTAWGEGGHCGRVYLNLRGRQPQGTVDPADKDRVLGEIERGLLSIPAPDGHAIATKVFRPEAIYRECRGAPPDLIVYFGDLDWRAVGSIGNGAIHLAENDTGPDQANHATRGVFMARVPGAKPGELHNMRLIDCGPAILRVLGAEGYSPSTPSR